MLQIPNFIQGSHAPPSTGSYLDVEAPATGDVCAQVADSNGNDVEAAVEAAVGAFPLWSTTSRAERSRLLTAIARGIEDNLESLAQLESRETGKPISLARNVDIPRAAANFRFFATAILHEQTEAYPTDQIALNYVTRQPRGAAALISPWNLPLYLFSWKVAPALAAGCTVVGKPSELTPGTAHRLTEICQQVGLPPGAFNVVHGLGSKVGAAMVSHPKLTTISFTGGTATGAEIARVAAPQFKRLTLELGGKNPNIVFADANLEEAVQGTVRASFENQGEVCLCGSRLLVERSIHDDFVGRLVEAAKDMAVGDPQSPETRMGALISKSHLAKVQSYLQLAKEEGGEILCGGKRPDRLPERCRNGYFLEPAVVTGLDARCRVNQEEIFGPVVTVLPFETEEEAIAMANATPFGLSSSLWTQDLDRAHRVASQIETGTVWVNCWLLRDLRAPFGGMKQSGIGREGGQEALHFFTEPRNVCIKLK